MRKTNVKAKLHAALDELPNTTLVAMLGMVQAFQTGKPEGDLKDLEGETRTRRRRRAEADSDETPARSTRRSRRAKDEDEEKPTRSRRRRAAKDEDEDEADDKPARSRRSKRAPKFEATLDGMDKFMQAFDGDPVEGTLKALKDGLAHYGADPDEVTDGITDSAEKKEVLGTTLAAMEALNDLLVAADADDLAALAEDLGVKPKRSNKATALAILQEFNASTDEADEDEEEDEDEAEESEEEEDEGDEDEDEADDKPSRRRRSKDSEDDLADLDDDKPAGRRKRRRADV